MSRRSLWTEGFTTLFKKPKLVTTPTEEVYQTGGFLETSRFSVSLVAIGIILFIILSALFLHNSILLLGLFTFSILPTLILFLWIIKTDRYEPEPKSLVISVVGIGGCIAALYSMVRFPPVPSYYFLKTLLIEFTFFLVLIGLDSNRLTGREFNDHMDGVVYGASLGLGYVAYMNFTTLAFTPEIINPTMLFLLSLEKMFLLVFPALAGWWIGYVKAKYTSISFLDLLAGFIPVIVLKLTYEAVISYSASLFIAQRFIVLILIGTLLLVILFRRVSWALEDERLWGYFTGEAPIERGH
jgi:hypothetical protein